MNESKIDEDYSRYDGHRVIYALRLEGDEKAESTGLFCYIGTSACLTKRLLQHRNGQVCFWTTRHAMLAGEVEFWIFS